MFQYGPSLHYVCDTLCCSYNLSKPPTHDPETFSAAIKGTKTLLLSNSFNFKFVTADWNDLKKKMKAMNVLCALSCYKL